MPAEEDQDLYRSLSRLQRLKFSRKQGPGLAGLYPDRAKPMDEFE